MSDMTVERGPVETAVCMGFDAMRVCTGIKPQHYTLAEIIRWMKLMKPEKKP